MACRYAIPSIVIAARRLLVRKTIGGLRGGVGSPRAGRTPRPPVAFEALPGKPFPLPFPLPPIPLPLSAFCGLAGRGGSIPEPALCTMLAVGAGFGAGRADLLGEALGASAVAAGCIAGIGRGNGRADGGLRGSPLGAGVTVLGVTAGCTGRGGSRADGGLVGRGGLAGSPLGAGAAAAGIP